MLYDTYYDKKLPSASKAEGSLSFAEMPVDDMVKIMER